MKPSTSMSERMAGKDNNHLPAYWDARYAEDGFAYGTEPNDFLLSVTPQLQVGDALCTELQGLDFVIARDGERLLKEGRYHDGIQRTAQVLAFRR